MELCLAPAFKCDARFSRTWYRGTWYRCEHPAASPALPPNTGPNQIHQLVSFSKWHPNAVCKRLRPDPRVHMYLTRRQWLRNSGPWLLPTCLLVRDLSKGADKWVVGNTFRAFQDDDEWQSDSCGSCTVIIHTGLLGAGASLLLA
jgi:hypothetical protein